MGVISDLVGLLKPDSDLHQKVIDAEEALQRLASKRDGARRELSALAERRRALLLADASDSEIQKLDAKTDSLRLLVERLDLAEPHLLEQLSVARGERRAAQWKELRAKHLAASFEYARALQAAIDAYNDYGAVCGDLYVAGFEAELRSVQPTVPLIVAPGNAQAFLFEIEQLHDAELARQKTPAETQMTSDSEPAKTVASAERPQKTSPPVAVDAAPPQPVAPKKARREPIVESPRDEEILVEIIRAGYEHNDQQCVVGDRIALPEKIARAVVRNSAGVFVDEEVSN